MNEGQPRDALTGTPYKTIARIGQGGMGEVLEAEHRGLNKRVVVKLLHRHIAGDPRFADRLRVEAQALAAVDSPHVVSVSDLGRTPAGRPYLVMERLHGQTLREVLDARGAIPVDEAIGWICQVLAGLAAAHQLGIIHRDIKPDNVFLCVDPTGRSAPVIKVLDFGIAKVLQADGSATPLPPPQYATEEGMLVGSPRTVSPEQVRFQSIDARTDLYAAGLLLYTLVAGRGPFTHARDLLQLLNAHVLEAPAPPSQLAAQYVPPELDRAILKALAKKPELRFQTAEAFVAELSRIADLLVGTTQPLRLQGPAALAFDDEPTPAQTTARGTLVIRTPPHSAPAPAPPADAPRSDLEAEAWFTPDDGATPMVELPPNLAAEAPRRVHVGTFAVLTLASTVLFSVLAALAFRMLGMR
jgi:serine/threonine-protein kinase